MSLNGLLLQQHLVGALSLGSADLRVSTSAGDLIAAGADRLIATGVYTRNQAQRLHNMKRQDRRAATDRSSFGTLLELAPLAPLCVSLSFLDRLAVEIVMRSTHPMPHPDDAHRGEEAANHAGNLVQLARPDRPSAGWVFDLNDVMGAQREASRILQLAEARNLTRILSLPS